MAVPFILFSGLSAIELVLFEAMQTGLDIACFISILSTCIFLRSRDTLKKNDGRGAMIKEVKKAAGTGLIIEASYVASTFSWFFLALNAFVGLIVLLLLYFGIPFFIFYLRYYKKETTKEMAVLLYFVIAVIPAIMISTFLTNLVFGAQFIFAF
nr:hypothetical protein [Candidatus Sigynarchaeota archaeon]